MRVSCFEEPPGRTQEGIFLDVVPRVAPVEFENEVAHLPENQNAEMMEVEETGEAFVVERREDHLFKEGSGHSAPIISDVIRGENAFCGHRDEQLDTGEEEEVQEDVAKRVISVPHRSLGRPSRQMLSHYLPIQLMQWESTVLWGVGDSTQEIKTLPLPSSPFSPSSILPCSINCDLGSGIWSNSVVWNSQNNPAPPQPAPLLMNMNDGDMFFNVGKTEHPKLLERQAGENGAISLAEREIRARMAEEKMVRLAAAARNTGFNYNADTTLALGKNLQQERSVPVQIPRMAHAQPAADKTLFKPPKLDDVKHFHRPRLPRSMLAPECKWVIRYPKKRTGGQGAGEAVRMRGGVVLNQMRRDKDLILTDGHFVLIEYIEEHPLLLGSLGMCSRIINWWRSRTAKSCQVRGAGTSSHSFGGGGAGINGALDDDRPPELAEGQTIILKAQEESPFMADIKPGRVQPSICNELYRAPLFQHEPRHTDFLLVSSVSRPDRRRPPSDRHPRPVDGEAATVEGNVEMSSKDGKGSTTVVTYIRQVQRVFLAGQMEPQREVYEPGKVEARSALSSFLSYHLGRLFEGDTGEVGVDSNKIRDLFKYMGPPPRDLLKRVMKDVAVLRNFQRWFRRPDVDLHTFVESAAYKFSPEDVCAFDSMLCAHRRLKDVGIRHLTSAESVTKVLISLKLRHDMLQALVVEARRVGKALSSSGFGGHDSDAATPHLKLAKMREALECQQKELERLREVAQFIHEQLQLCPWALSSSFVRHQLQGQGNGMMRLSGLGDPSAAGEGFSFLPKPQEAAKPQSKNPEVNLDQLAMRKVTGTSADLRKLNMRELEKQLMDLGMEKEVVAPLHRWDRVRMISVLANKAVLGNTEEAASVRRFTRKHRHSTAWEKRLYKNNCQEIWDRQAQALALGEDDVQAYGTAAEMGASIVDTSAGATASGGEVPSADKGSPSADMAGDGRFDDDEDDEDGLGDLLQDIDKEGEEGGGGEEAAVEKRRMADLVRRAPTTASEAAARDEEQALREMRRQLALEKDQPIGIPSQGENRSIGLGGRSGGEVGALGAETERLRDVLASIRPRLPGRAVKEVRRKVHPDGRETIHIRFILDPAEVVRVDRAEYEGGGSSRPGSTPLGNFIPDAQTAKQLIPTKIGEREGGGGGTGVARGRNQRRCTDAYADEDEELIPTKINLSRMVSQVQEHKEQKKRKRLANRQEEADLYRGPKKTCGSRSRSRGTNAPRILFAQKLTEIVDNLLSRVDACAFKAPVSKRLLPEYHRRIKRPMDLGTIRSKAQGVYRSADELLLDLALMSANAADFNGPQHSLALTAAKILEDGQLQVRSQSEHLSRLQSQMAVAVHRITSDSKKSDQKSTKAKRKRVAKAKKAMKACSVGAREQPRTAFSSENVPASRPFPFSSVRGAHGGDTSSDSGEEMVVMESTIR
jgi:hypothetical protein